MLIKLGVIMDPIRAIHYKKDSTLAMLLAAQAKGWSLLSMEQGDLFLADHKVQGICRPLKVYDDPQHWYELGDPMRSTLDTLDVILMRKDPPFDLNYVYTTQLLQLLHAAGVLVVNNPQALRDANEKLFTSWFPQCTPPMLVTSQASLLQEFHAKHQDIILKPLDSMGGTSIFRLQKKDPNLNVIIETITKQGQCPIMAQRYIPEITQGDKRILLIDGEPIPYALARIPLEGETRANLARGGTGAGVILSKRDRFICEQIAPTLRQKGLLFVGIDVIGDYLTEINVTSPTCIRELDTIYDLNIGAAIMDCIEQKLKTKPLMPT